MTTRQIRVHNTTIWFASGKCLFKKEHDVYNNVIMSYDTHTICKRNYEEDTI